MHRLKKISFATLLFLIALNIVAYIHAYKFTHFSPSDSERTKDPKELSTFTKLKVLVSGIDNPRPAHTTRPNVKFKTISIESDVTLEGWLISSVPSNGTVILFHGYSGEKSSLISRADQFIKLGYNTLLIDFRGSGGSGGDGTSIGFWEAVEVKDCYNFVQALGEDNIILFGTSMGAAAILKAINDYQIVPSSIILECPFGSLYKTVCARFRMMNVPTVPMAALLTFWGGAQNKYWAFAHNPADYAKTVTSPTLLLFGELDDRVTMEETQEIFNNLQGQKKLVTYPDIGHHIFIPENEERWIRDVTQFLQ